MAHLARFRPLFSSTPCLLLLATVWGAEVRDFQYDAEDGKTMFYRVYLPEDFDPSREYPLVTFLHGTKTPINSIDQIGNATEFLVETLRGDEYPAILLAPESINGNWGKRSPDEERDLRVLTEVIDVVLDDFSIDTRRQYVTGLSAGGFGTWNMLSLFPERFAAALPTAGGCSSSTCDPSEFLASREIPVWAFHGARDEVVPVETTRLAVDAFRTAGGNVRYTEFTNGTHNVWDRTYNDEPYFSVTLSLEVDTSAGTFALTATDDSPDGAGIDRFLVDLTGVATIENVSPKADLSIPVGTKVGFTERRSGPNALPLEATQKFRGEQILGFGRTAGMLPGAGTGEGEVQPVYGVPLLLAEGSYSSLDELDFEGLLSTTTAAVINQAGQIRPAVVYKELLHDGVTVYSSGDDRSVYEWLFSHQLVVPEPGSAWLLILAVVCVGPFLRHAACR